MVEVGESGMSVRNMQPGEWLKANGGSERDKLFRFSAGCDVSTVSANQSAHCC